MRNERVSCNEERARAVPSRSASQLKNISVRANSCLIQILLFFHFLYDDDRELYIYKQQKNNCV